MAVVTRKRIAYSFFLLLFFAVTGFFLLHAPVGGLLEASLEKRIGRMLGAAVAFDDLDVRLHGRVQARSIRIDPGSAPGEAIREAPIRLSDVSARYSLASIIAGRYSLDTLEIGSISADADEELLGWIAGVREERIPIADLPPLEIRDGAVNLDALGPLHPFRIQNIRLSAFWPEAHRAEGELVFSAGGNDVHLAFEKNRGQGFAAADVTVDGFDLSILAPAAFSPAGFDFSRAKVRGILSGRVTWLFGSEQLVGDLILTGLTAGHPETGLVIANGSVGIQVSGRDVVFHDARFRIADGRVHVPAARFQAGASGLEPVRLHGSMTGLDLSRLHEMGVFSLFPAQFQPLLIDSGELGAVFEGQRDEKETMQARADLEISGGAGVLRDPEVAFEGFDAAGTVSSSGRVDVDRAEARFWEGSARAEGSFDLPGKHSAKGISNLRMDIHATDIAQNETLIGLLPGAVRKGFRMAGPSGARVGGDIRFDEDGVLLDLAVSGKSLSPPALPLVFSDVSGRIRWATGGTEVVFEDVSGNVDGSGVRGRGSLWIDAPLRGDIFLQANDLALTPELLDWLGIRPEPLRLTGRFDLDLSARGWRPEPGSVIRSLRGVESRIELDEVAAFHPEHGLAAESAGASLLQKEEGLTIDAFHGLVYGIAVAGSGHIPFDDAGKKAHVDIETESFDLSRKRVKAFFPDGIPDTVDMKGRARLFGTLHADPAKPGGREGLSGEIFAELKDAAVMMSGNAPEDASEETPGDSEPSIGDDTPGDASDNKSRAISGDGTVRVLFSGGRFSGNMHFHGLQAAGITARRLSADFGYRAPALSFQNIHLRAFGGSINSETIRIDTDQKTWHAGFDAEGVDLSDLVRSLGVLEDQSPEGRLRAELSLEGHGLDTGSFRGGGNVTIEDGKLYSFPLLVAVLRVFDLRLPTQSPVTDAYGGFTVADGAVSIDHLLFTGGPMPIYMEGTIGLQSGIAPGDQPISMIVTSTRNDGILDRIPLVNLFKQYTVDLLRSIVFQARVTGTVGDYRVIHLSNPVTDQVRKMWGFFETVVPPQEE